MNASLSIPAKEEGEGKKGTTTKIENRIRLRSEVGEMGAVRGAWRENACARAAPVCRLREG